MANRNNFITGITEMLILRLLEDEDSYVYAISKSIQELSGDYLSISQNTLYSATYKLENEGYISEYSKKVGKKRIRVYYTLEPKGKEYLDSIQGSYLQVIQGVQSIFQYLDTKHDKGTEQ